MVFGLLILSSIIPPILLAYSAKLVYVDKNRYGIHIQYISKYLITLSCIVLMLVLGDNSGLLPKNEWSIVALILTVILSFVGIPFAIKRKNLFFYNSGITAGFMEEFLYRGVIFGLCINIWNDNWVALGVSSLLFGAWHLKNVSWCGLKQSVIQLTYTAFVYGPIFGLLRIYSGDLYLAILCHFLVDATVALAPNWMRGWLVYGGKGKPYEDEYAGI